MEGLLYWGWRVAASAAQRVPTRAGYAVASLLGEIAYLVWTNKRVVTKHNFAAVLRRGPDERAVAETARRSFREFAKYIFEIMRFPKLSAADLARLVEIEGWQHLDRALEQGNGVIFVSFHFGNFELGGARIAGQGDRPLNVIADDLRSQRLFELLIGHRAEKGIRIISPKGAAKAVLGSLRRNEMVGFLMDLGPRAAAFDSVDVRFFDRETRFPAVAANLARVSGAPIIVGCVVRRGGRPFLGILNEPISVERTKRAVEDVQRATQRMVTDLERFVTSWPEQWYIFRPMWPLERREGALPA